MSRNKFITALYRTARIHRKGLTDVYPSRIVCHQTKSFVLFNWPPRLDGTVKVSQLLSTAKAAAVIAAGAMLLAACGGTADSASSSTEAAASSSSTISAELGDPQARLETLYAGTFTEAPTGGPKPAAGKNVWIISYLQAYVSAASTAQAAQDAATALGWESTVFDAEGDPAQAVAGIRQAVAAKADVIFTIYFDCESIKAGLIAAKDAGVVRVANESRDCEGSPLFDYVVTYNPGTYAFNDGSFGGYLMGWQASTADYIIAKSGGKAKTILIVQPDTAAALLQAEGFRTQMTSCPDCSIVAEVNILGTELGAATQQKVQQALLQHPEADSIAVPGDAFLTGGVIGAMKAAGVYGKMIIGGGEGSDATVGLARDYPGDWGLSLLPVKWEGWQAMDAANRIIGGQEPALASGIGYQIIDKDHNMPATDEVVVTKDGQPIDYPAQYKAAWAAAS
ncbi:MAG: substrate-binding domain-containing protein [Actinobacteria bacterium]|uniref:Unannotated protein n=1 Tax=freshwater metagenome TaxID=449393 RepID=A0A6J7M1A1_9ZZZZ|nr:substrate-binding domain-containing protein [Actinomycetota bacterium]